jgi:hypothetical protein
MGRNPLDVLVDLNRMAAIPDAEGNRPRSRIHCEPRS